MSFGHALYYPHINLTNKNWLKQSCLFWDKISRIVPHQVQPEDSEEVVKLRYETDFIENYSPETYVTSQTFSEFARFIEDLLTNSHFFNDKFFRFEDRSRNYSYYERHRREMFSEIVKRDGVYIHVEKIDERLKHYLFELGLALPGENEWSSWIKVDNEIGYFYMTYLAKSISKRKSIPIVTDEELSFSASIYCEKPIFDDWRGQFEYRIGALMINNYIPKDINAVPLNKLIEIRNKYKDERAAFFNQISELTTNLPEIDNENALKDAINFHGKLIAKQSEDLKKLYHSHKIDAVNKFLTISIPSVLASTSEYIPSEWKPLGTTFGIVFGIISAAKSIQKDRIELKNNPLSYLLNLQAEVETENPITRLNRKLSGLIK